MNTQITFAQYSAMTEPYVKKMSKLVDKMVANAHRKTSKQYAKWMVEFLAIANKLGEDGQDFIEYFNL